MDQKPKIEYVGQFYIYDGLARKQEEKQIQILRTMPKKTGKVLYVDPLALGGIVLALVLGIALLVGALQFRSDWRTNTEMKRALNVLQYSNMQLDTTYRKGYDLEAIEAAAKKLGMIPASEADVCFMTVTLPEEKPAPSLLDDVIWFCKGLFSKEPVENVVAPPETKPLRGRR